MGARQAGEPEDEASVVIFDDGRRIAYRTYGDAKGFPVLALHGTPGSGSKFASAHTMASARGLRIIALERWGYGGSDAPRAPNLAGFAQDMSRFADRLDLDRIAVFGVSGGAPYAVAVAAGLADRIAALALVAPVGQIAAAHGLGMSPFHGFCFRVLPHIPGLTRATFAVFRSLLRVSPGLAIGLMTLRAGGSDRAIMSIPAERAALARSFLEGIGRGLDGPVVDMALFARRWEISLGTIVAPARLWIGEADTNVPVGVAAALADDIPRCSLVLLQGEGHYWVTQHMADVGDWIAKTVGGPQEAADPRR